MALGATVYRASINLSNLNTHNYEDLSLTLAKHPSESESRLMYRLVAYLFCAHQDLQFGKGVSNPEEPDIWQKNYTGEILQWIELGTPDLKKIRQASGRSSAVKVFTYNPNSSQEWFDRIKSNFIRNDKVKIFNINVTDNGPIEKLASKGMKLSCIIEDSSMYLANDDDRICIEITEAK